MEKLMFRFLDVRNPGFFRYRTKFGIIPRYNRKGDYVVGDIVRKDIVSLCNFFSCEFEYASSVYKKWLETKPVYVRIKNSTNDNVFIPESEVNNVSTTNYKVGN